MRTLGYMIGYATALMYALVTITQTPASVPIEPLGPRWVGYGIFYVANMTAISFMLRSTWVTVHRIVRRIRKARGGPEPINGWQF